MALDLGLALAVIFFLDVAAVAIVTIMELSAGRSSVLVWEEESPLKPLLAGSVVVFLAALLSLIEIRLPGSIDIRLNAGGVVVPIVATGVLLYFSRPKLTTFLTALAITALAAFILNLLSEGRFGLSWEAFLLLVTVVALASCLLSRWKFYDSATLAYTSATLGIFLGVDVVDLFSFPGPGPLEISLGAQGILDLVFLTGILAITAVWLLFLVRASWTWLHPAAQQPS